MRTYLMRGILAGALAMMWGGCGTPVVIENNTCDFPNDGECDDGRPCAETALCESGTDANDCAGVGDCPTENSCVYANDGECDEGGACDPGTDENDCT
jgi:hypothetical protein